MTHEGAHELVLHSYRRCPFAIRVRMTLAEKQIPYTVVEESLADMSETLLKLHPQARVPLLIHGPHVIYESSVITEYLNERFPEHDLMPRVPAERAQVRLWTHWCDEIYKPDLDAFKYEYRKLAESAQTELLTRMHGHLEKLEQALASAPFLMGNRITLADIHVFPFYRQLTRVQPEFPDLSRYLQVAAWLARITARPTFAKVMAGVDKAKA